MTERTRLISYLLHGLFIMDLSLVCKIVSKPYWTCQFPHTGVRKGAVMALGQFCSVFHNLLQEAGAEDKTACMFIVVFLYKASRAS